MRALPPLPSSFCFSLCVLLKGRRWEEEKEWERKEQLVPGRGGGRGWKGQIQAELAVRDSRIIITTGGATVEGREYALGHLGVHQLSIKKDQSGGSMRLRWLTPKNCKPISFFLLLYPARVFK